MGAVAVDSKRKYPRFSSPVPIALKQDGEEERVVLPRDISLGGCYFESVVDVKVNKKILSLKVLTNENISVKNPRIIPHCNGDEGCAVSWEIDGKHAAQFDQHLREKCGSIGDAEKIEYIKAEQSYLTQAIQSGEEAKEKRMRSVYLLVVAYLALAIVPMRLDASQITREFLSFYSIAGLWGSVGILVYLMRHLRFLGNHYRRKSMYYKALNLNRAYVFDGDYKFYEGTVFPMGVHYAANRQGPLPPQQTQGAERHFLWYPSFYMIFIQALFVAGMLHFLGMILRALDTSGFTAGGILREGGLFSVKYFRIAATSFLIVVIGWLQMSCTHCMFYSRKVWEARRMDVTLPDPRCPRLCETLPAIAKRYRYFGFLLAILAAAQIFYVFPIVRDEYQYVSSVLVWWFHPFTAIVLAVLFFVMKIFYTKDSIRNASAL